MKNYIQEFTDDELYIIDVLANSPVHRTDKELGKILKDAKRDIQAFNDKVKDIRDFYESV
jgi:uncharacterized protein YegJ (DUF2314 family)